MTRIAKTRLRLRVVKPGTNGQWDSGTELTADLPHLTSSWTVEGMQPGNPGSASTGAWSVQLHPPGSPGFRKNRDLLLQLEKYQRVEAYLSHDGSSLGGAPYKTGIVTRVDRDRPRFEISGEGDVALAKYSIPFPGEFISNTKTSAQLKTYLGMNEPGAIDNFNPYTSGNYNSSNIPAHTSGSWSADTDDGFAVVKCSTGTGAALINKTGMAAHDRWNTHYVEATGRLFPSADLVNAGVIGIGMTQSNANCDNSIVAWVVAYKVVGATRWILNATIAVYVAGALNGSVDIKDVLSEVDDPEGYIPLTLGLLNTMGGQGASGASAVFTVNGKPVAQVPTSFDPGTGTWYPFLLSGTPASGSATAYLTNLLHATRFAVDGASTASVFTTGSVTTGGVSLPWGKDAGPNFLDTWGRAATREGFYWRYTPARWASGSRTLGAVDFAADPGTDRTKTHIFSTDKGNLISLHLTENADAYTSGTQTTGLASPDGGGEAYVRDIGTIARIGLIEDQTLAMHVSDFPALRRFSSQIIANKIAVGNAGAKVIVVPVDEISLQVRELDKVTVHDPEHGVLNASARVMGIRYDEGGDTLTFILDGFPWWWSSNEVAV